MAHYILMNIESLEYIRESAEVSKMGGVISVIPPVNVSGLKTGECIIPVIPELASELDSGKYDPDYGSVNVRKIVERQFGDLFDEKGNLIIHK